MNEYFNDGDCMKKIFLFFFCFILLSKASQEPSQTTLNNIPTHVLTHALMPAFINVSEELSELKKTLAAFVQVNKYCHQSFKPFIENENLNEIFVNKMCQRFDILYKAHAAQSLSKEFFATWLKNHPWEPQEKYKSYLDLIETVLCTFEAISDKSLMLELFNTNLNLHEDFTACAPSTIFDALYMYEFDLFIMSCNSTQAKERIHSFCKNGLDVNFNSEQFLSPLSRAFGYHFSIWKHNNEAAKIAIKTLLHFKADINAIQKFRYGTTLLKYATDYNVDSTIKEFLVQHGALKTPHKKS